MRWFSGVLTIFLLLLVIGLGAALAWLVFTRSPYEFPYRPDAPTYGVRGAYTVGVRDFTIEGDGRALNGWVWYPASGQQDLANYSQFNGVLEVSGRANWDAQPVVDDGPYPLVVYSHGSGSSPLFSLYYLEHLASHGIVVVAVEHPGNTVIDRLGSSQAYDDAVIDNYAHRPRDISRAIDYALETLATGFLDGMIDGERIAVSGHSFGGYTAFAAAGAQLNFDALTNWCEDNQGTTIGDLRDEASLTRDNRDVLLTGGTCYLIDDAPRIANLLGFDTPPDGQWGSPVDSRVQAVIALAPWNAPIFGEESLGDVDVPSLILVGSNDNTTQPERDARNFYGWLGTDDRMLVEFQLADHSLFIDRCPPVLINMGSFSACSDPVWDLARAHDITNHLATAFLLSHFAGDVDASAAIQPENIDFAGITVQTP